MATGLRLGSADHGRPMTFQEFMTSEFEEGYHYEIINGRLYVSPKADYPHDWVETYVFEELLLYRRIHPEVINRVTTGARVFVPEAMDVTAPEPDIAAYHDAPEGPNLNWRQINPVLVVEVLGGNDDEKDLVRNVDLYLRIPSIQEYWVFDIREDPTQPTLRVHRRKGDSWEVWELGPDATYTTSLLPNFALAVNPGHR